MKPTDKKIKEMLEDDTDFRDFYAFLREDDIGCWDMVNSEETVKNYISEMMNKGFHVSNLLKAIEENPSTEELYCVWLGSTLKTPTPINTKKDLVEALGIEVS